MAKYILAYHGTVRPSTPEAGQKMMADWRTWMNSIKASVLNPGNPAGPSKTVSKTGVTNDGGPSPLAGFTIVQADNIDGAIALAKGCPHLDYGTIEVAELMDMEM